MTNTIAAVLAVLLICAVAIDVYFVGDAHLIFLAKELMALIEWLAFWR